MQIRLGEVELVVAGGARLIWFLLRRLATMVSGVEAPLWPIMTLQNLFGLQKDTGMHGEQYSLLTVMFCKIVRTVASAPPLTCQMSPTRSSSSRQTTSYRG